ncbi:MAG: UDP-N-acetylglucosamine 2-epimerase (non-hydrolyzing), partial [Oceanospirillales bacterium]|nr:UDP-N-acetylglucosamine 2-epimerase (non-hydrolyzing) [Oceanospirillales bacterium]
PEIEQAIIKYQPDRVLVDGDNNATLAGSLAAAKLHGPIDQVEAGLRSFNTRMPEEINRILTDQISDLLFCPTTTAVKNLQQEGFGSKPVKVMQVGDVMQDAALFFAKHSAVPEGFAVEPGFILTTLHRAENTDDPERLASIVAALNQLHAEVAPVVLPLHPRTRNVIAKLGLAINVYLIEPVGYFEMVWLLDHAGLVLTDSGGVQKEAFFFGKACVTMRDQTEWVELVEAGVNELVGADGQKIIAVATRNLGRRVQDTQQLYDGGQASQRIVAELLAREAM